MHCVQKNLLTTLPIIIPTLQLDASIAVNGEVSACPWQPDHKLIRIGIKGKSVAKQDYPYANFVLLIDVSGSMQSPDKLELLKNSFIEFVKGMRPQDKLAIVTYAGDAGLVLDATSGNEKDKIIDKLKILKTGGSTRVFTPGLLQCQRPCFTSRLISAYTFLDRSKRLFPAFVCHTSASSSLVLLFNMLSTK